MTSIVADCSLLCHAALPSQRTESAAAALAEIVDQDHELLYTPAMVAEFLTVLRKFVNTRDLELDEAEAIRDVMFGLNHTYQGIPAEQFADAWELACQLNQRDVFDSVAYIVAQDAGAELWTCDGRFANALATAGLTGARRFA